MRRVVYYVRTNKYLRRLCRLLLNLTVLSLLGFLVWFGIQLFTGQWSHDSLLGGLVFIVALGVFIWLSRLGLKSHWQPNMKLTVLSLVALFLVFAFAGVRPFTGYKDVAATGIHNLVDRISGSVAMPSLSPAVYIESTYLYPCWDDCDGYDFEIMFSLVPEHALPYPQGDYVADFYVRGKLRSSKTVWFTERQVNEGFVELVVFPIADSARRRNHPPL